MKKLCELCGHSRAAHVDRRCVLCDCVSEQRTFVQDSFAFRGTLPQRTAALNARKR